MILEIIPVGPLAVNCLLIGCKETGKAALIDPGDEAKRLQSIIDGHNLKLDKILLTHGHVDHVGAVVVMKQATGAMVYGHEGDAEWLENAAQHAVMFGLPDPGVPVLDHTVKEGDRVTVGNLVFDVFHTPGHSAGSVSYVIDGHAFVGDLLFQHSIGRTDLPGGDYDTLIHSVKTKIFSMQDDVIVYPGHGPITQVGVERRENPFFIG